jgi:hypothetical protein
LALGAIIADGINIGGLRKGAGEAKEKNHQADRVSQFVHKEIHGFGMVPTEGVEAKLSKYMTMRIGAL